ncbi:MAG: hypothetical protein P8Y47_04880 [Alphaproteobacteria bacterium]
MKLNVRSAGRIPAHTEIDKSCPYGGGHNHTEGETAINELDAAMAKPLTVIKARREDGKTVKMVYVPIEGVFKIYIGTSLEALAGDQNKAATRFRIAMNSYLPKKGKVIKTGLNTYR